MSEKPNISTSKTKNKSKLSKLKKKGKNKQVERRSGSKELLKTGGQDCKGRSKEDMSGNSNFTYCRRYGGWYGDRELCDFQQKAVKCLLPHHRSQPTSGRADSASTSSTDFATVSQSHQFCWHFGNRTQCVLRVNKDIGMQYVCCYLVFMFL